MCIYIYIYIYIYIHNLSPHPWLPSTLARLRRALAADHILESWPGALALQPKRAARHPLDSPPFRFAAPPLLAVLRKTLPWFEAPRARRCCEVRPISVLRLWISKGLTQAES